MEGYTFYLVLLGVLVLLLLGGGLLRKALKKVDVDLTDSQLDMITVIVADAVSQVEEINRKLEASGGRKMSPKEQFDVALELSKGLAEAAGVSAVKVDILLKLLQAVVSKKEAGGVEEVEGEVAQIVVVKKVVSKKKKKKATSKKKKKVAKKKIKKAVGLKRPQKRKKKPK